MRTLVFWFGLVFAFLCGQIDPVWGYAAVAALSVLQLAMLGGPGGSVFLLMHYTTILTYFSLAPAMQIAAHAGFWDVGLLGTAAHTQALSLLLLYLAGVEAARLGVPEAPGPAARHPDPYGVGVAHPFLLLGCLLAAFAVLFIRPDMNFVARGIQDDDDLAPVLNFILLSMLPKLVVLMCFTILAIQAFRRRTPWAWCAAGLAMAPAIIAADPISTPRQILVIGLLPLLIHWFGRRRRWTLAALIFGCVAGLGPVLNLISRGSLWGEALTTFPFSPDFDAMFVVAGILERAPAPDLGFGRYLLSAFSFFLPHDLKLFPDFDPLSWSAILGNFSQRNLSLPPFTTAYFDFGLLGPVLLGFAISALFRAVDKAVDPRRALSGTYLCALVLLAAYVPFLRGPILGWGPFAASGLIAALITGALSARRHSPAHGAVRSGIHTV